MNLYCTVKTCFFSHRLYHKHELVLFGEETKVPEHFRKCRRIRGKQSLSEREQEELEGEVVRDPATLGRALSCFAIPEETRKVLSAQLSLASHRRKDILDDRQALDRARDAAARHLEIEKIKKRPGWWIDYPEYAREVMN